MKRSIPNQSLGTILTALREDRGWSAAELARRAGVDPATLSRTEAGTKTPALRTLFRIARTLGVSVDDLADRLGYGVGLAPARQRGRQLGASVRQGRRKGAIRRLEEAIALLQTEEEHC